MKKIGYVRVSTQEQSADSQLDALASLCDELHVERLSPRSAKRPVYQRVMRSLKAGDMLVILDLDRAYHSTVDANAELQKLKAKGTFLRIVNLDLDTSTPDGSLVHTIVAACAACEWQMRSQRTREGIVAARERGKAWGRPRKLDARQLAQARRRLQNPHETLTSVARDYGVAQFTLTRSLRREDQRGLA